MFLWDPSLYIALMIFSPSIWIILTNILLFGEYSLISGVAIVIKGSFMLGYSGILSLQLLIHLHDYK